MAPIIDKENPTTLGSGVVKKETENKGSQMIFLPVIPKFRLSDMVLPQNVIDSIYDATYLIENTDLIFNKWGLKNTHKFANKTIINLYGPPGSGKTMGAHAIADLIGKKIICVNYADIESKYVGETPKNIKKAFDCALETKSVLFFDEADAIFSRRVTNMTNSTDVSVNQTRSVILMLLNDFEGIVILATNFMENIDPAFIRRISAHIELPYPDLECRKKLWAKYIPEELPNDLNIVLISELFEQITGSDIYNAVLMAAKKTARSKQPLVKEEYFHESIKSILAARDANSGGKYKQTVITQRLVSEKYAKKQIAKSRRQIRRETK